MPWKSNIFATLAVLLVTNSPKTYGISLQCLYHHVYLFDSYIYTCTASVLLDGNENVTSVTGTHETGKGYEDVQGIHLPLQNLPFFPTNIEHFFTNITEINLYRNSITAISNKDLIPFPNLRFLSLWYNNITALDGDLFYGINSLVAIDFGGNSITNVGHDLNLPSIAYFDGNVCIDEIAFTPEEIAALKLNLLRKCPPTIAQIEDSLKKRQNLFTYIDGQVESLINITDELNKELKTLLDDQVTLVNLVFGLTNRILYLEDIIRNNIGEEVVVDED